MVSLQAYCDLQQASLEQSKGALDSEADGAEEETCQVSQARSREAEKDEPRTPMYCTLAKPAS